MKILPLDPLANRSLEALTTFLSGVRAQAEVDGQSRLVSISVEAERLDPLAVLESIFEPGELHFYVERPAADLALAGAEAVVSLDCAGPGRFAAAAEFVRETLARTIAVGAVQMPFGGPLFFSTFGFADEATPDAPFPAGRVFVPRWQVARTGDCSVAVANTMIGPGADVHSAAERIWRAHAKFGAFDYASPSFTDALEGAIAEEREVGPEVGYAANVAAGVAAIRAGRYRKIVLARARDLRATRRFHPLRALNVLRGRFPDCYAFSAGNGAGASFIGASPERLVAAADGRLRTEALAGSAPRGRTAAEDAALARQLLHSGKDAREQGLVLESIVRRLANVGVTAVAPGKPRVRQLPNVQHLCTPVEATLAPGADLLRILGELHPTPAVGGSPREPAVAHLRELEPFDRGLYAGALGWVNYRGDGEFLVGIRSALMRGDAARLYAGAGIVEGSDPSAERAETELKMRALREALLG
ncbi:MAG TPA: isochorismate synthase [Opitutaceae bacterium]|nr:isochorismate synthase [Opitutaceae bacterium]